MLAEKLAGVDLPILFVGAGKRDWTVGWSDKPPFVRAMENSRHSLVLYWMTGSAEHGHNMPWHTTLWRDIRTPNRLVRYRLDQS
jgi:hypothetical protein